MSTKGTITIAGLRAYGEVGKISALTTLERISMRKQKIQVPHYEPISSEVAWLPLSEIAQVEISSEDANHPIESALLPNQGDGWRADIPGVQLIRLRFDSPQRLQRIRL